MDIVNFDALIAQGKILKATDINPNEDYLLVGKYNKRTKEFEASHYPPYAIKISDLNNSNNSQQIHSFTKRFNFTELKTVSVNNYTTFLTITAAELGLNNQKAVILRELTTWLVSDSANINSSTDVDLLITNTNLPAANGLGIVGSVMMSSLLSPVGEEYTAIRLQPVMKLVTDGNLYFGYQFVGGSGKFDINDSTDSYIEVTIYYIKK